MSLLPFRTFNANGITLVRSAGIFHKRVVKIFTLLTDHLAYGHHFNLSGASRATIEQFHRQTCARVCMCKEDGGEGRWWSEQCRPDRFRARINDPRSLYNAFLALIQCVTAR